LPTKYAMFHVCVYAAPFGVIPLELDEVYPLSQHEVAIPPDCETIDYVAERVKSYIAASSFRKIVLLEDLPWNGRVSAACRRIKRKDLSITVLSVKETLNDEVLDSVVETLQRLAV
jgi:predicted RNA-binding protein